ncbi:MAG: rRNA maturation RNase YbeY, partial [Bryobacterales bacterium]|nr:rRNA maturation RNase YbeY [Bryobacterales bacterium]
YPTDVLSFPEPAPGFLGEIAISVDRAAAQAAEFGHTLEEEIEILMLHGALHLSGMDHEKDKGQMARAESKWRKHFGLPRGLIQRARKRS